ncbi:UNVERIFIED_CONTAM: hypothetical protein FKN15_036525 [Acipenser sinensis]
MVLRDATDYSWQNIFLISVNPNPKAAFYVTAPFQKKSQFKKTLKQLQWTIALTVQ